MITTTSGTGLVFPKGGWEDDESVETAAQRETVEEAGLRGVLEEPLLGVFSFASGKSVQAANGNSGRCKAFMYVMHVAEELPTWPESTARQRVWCTLDEASRLCKHRWMREALQAWVKRKGWDEVHASLVMADGPIGQQQQGPPQPQPLRPTPAAAEEPPAPQLGASSSAHFTSAMACSVASYTVAGAHVPSNST